MGQVKALRQAGTIKKIGYKKNEKMNFLPGRDIPIYLLLAPAVILLLIFHYIPIYGIVMGFQNYSPFKGVMKSEWVGLYHFKKFLTDASYWRVMKNTVIINIYSLIFAFPAPIVFALLLNEITNMKFKRTVQTISYLPYFISWVVTAGLVISILSPTTGVVNIALNKIFGIQPIYFMIKKEYFRTILICSGIWKGIGMSSIYYLATISNIDPTLYEAATIDGANKWRQTWHITLPGLYSIITVLLLLQIGSLLSIGFEQIFLLYNPMVYEVADVISTYTYRLGIEETQFSATTAIGFTQSVVNFILLYIANKIARNIAGWSVW
ncbi:MAG: sugar ABC transporter permease [Clostridiaceae bacterium]|nr:sugar ABC transporter permease [Clostridiaceae bacterium]